MAHISICLQIEQFYRETIMKLLLILTFAFIGIATADEVTEVKKELLEVRKELTQLQNRVTIPHHYNKQDNWFFDIPVGIQDDDWFVGLNVGTALTEEFTLRVDLHLMGENKKKLDEDWGPLLILSHQIGLMGKSPVSTNMRMYGGVFAGYTQELNESQRGLEFIVTGLGGIEFFVEPSKAYFIETGGGYCTANDGGYYGSGAMISGGQRFYF